eukprot:jgi/Psemu1/55199/gm1.55199_g
MPTDKMNTQFQLCIQYKQTFDVTEDHDSHKLVVDYARVANRSAGKKKNIWRVKNLEVEEIFYTAYPKARGRDRTKHPLKFENTIVSAELIPFSITLTCYLESHTEQQRKRMFFKTHPRSWQDAYIDMAVNFREEDTDPDADSDADSDADLDADEETEEETMDAKEEATVDMERNARGI